MNQSYWIETSVSRTYKSLDSSKECECAVVGGGIVGLTTAYLLSKEGKKVIVVDADKIGAGCTGRNTGKITTQHNIIYSKIKSKYGIEKAKLYYKGNKEALDFIETTIKNNEISCEFKRTTSYLYAITDKGLKEIKEEFEVCNEIGIECELLSEIPIPIEVKGAIAFNNVAEFNPKMYCDCLGDLIIKNGGEIYENSPIVEVERGEKTAIKTRHEKYIQSSYLVFASHYPFFDGASLYFSRLRPIRSYIVAASAGNGFVEGMFIGVEKSTKSIHYINGNGEKLLLIGGESHTVGQGKDTNYYEILEGYGIEEFGVKEYKYRWSAEDYATPDSIPLIGELNDENKNIFIATGFYKWGMTSGTLASIIISEKILKGESEYEDVFKPSRAKSILSKEFIKFNSQIVYHYAKGKLEMGELDAKIDEGEGKVIFFQGKRCGAYRDLDGELYILDITCTHLGCELNWNPIEKSWDCPCHGSRFSFKGYILEGPATQPLKRVEEGKNKVDPQLN